MLLLSIISTFDFINGNLFEELYEKHSGKLYNIVLGKVGNPHDAEEIVNDTFFKVWCSIKRFKNLGEDETISLLVKYTKNQTIDYFRKKQRRVQTIALVYEDEDSDELMEHDIPDFSYSPEPIIMDEESCKQLEKHINNLPDSQREVLELKYSLGMSNLEISEVLSISVELVNTRIFRAKRTLYKILKEESDEYTR